jgi:hypothetical protein
MGRLTILLGVSAALLLSACLSQVSDSAINSKLRTPIVLDNNETVSNCLEYQLGRATHGLLEGVNNRIIAKEYLPCSLNGSKAIAEDEAYKVAQQLLSLRVRQLPLSIAQLYGSQTLLRDTNFQQVENKLLWSQEQHNIEIHVKAIDLESKTRYLIWVSDLITDGNYHSYYPAWVDTSKGALGIKVSPVYESGY